METRSLIDRVNVIVDGEGEESIFMIHGWPDTPDVWNKQVAFFKDRYRCVRLTLPSYQGPDKREKFTIEQLVELIKDAIDQNCSGKAILMVHDWGAGFGYQFYNRHPERVSSIIGVDIGDLHSYMASSPISAKFMTLTYQLTNVLTWFMGRFGGDFLTRLLAKMFNAPAAPGSIYSNMNWPYYMFWCAGKDAYKNTFTTFDPTCPFLFIYGADKPMMFHDTTWANEIGAKPNNACVGFNSDHWVMVREPERFNQVTLDWLNSIKP